MRIGAHVEAMMRSSRSWEHPAEDDAADHGQNQADKRCIASQLHNGVDENGGKTGDGDGSLR